MASGAHDLSALIKPSAPIAAAPTSPAGEGGGAPSRAGRGNGIVVDSDKESLWTKDTDLVLRDLVLRQGTVDWTKIAETIEWDTGCVTAKECQARWDEVKETPVKGPWSSEEDDHLKRLVEIYGAKKWNLLARAFPGRSGKQCRERWHNHVDERVKKGEWTAEEDQILCEAQRQLGNKWSEMSRILHGRSENAIKNRFNSLNAKGLTEMRANELMSKLGPEAAEEYIQSGPPPPPPPPPQQQQPQQQQQQPQPQPQPAQECEEEEEQEGGRGDRSRGRGGRDGRSRSSAHRDEGDDFLPARGGGRGGGSSALRALMVAVTDERAACMDCYEEGEEGGWGRGRGSYTRGRGDMRREWGAGLDRRRFKRERRGGADGMVVEACRGQGRGGLVRRKSEMAKAEAGMSVLAQAAGLVDMEDEEEEAGGEEEEGEEDSDNSSGGPYGNSNGRRSTASTNSSGSTAFDRSSGSGHRRTKSATLGYNGHNGYNDAFHRRQTNSSNGRAGGGGGGGVDHGSTPPGSASPLPNGMGGGAAGDNPCGDGGIDTAFALGAQETVNTTAAATAASASPAYSTFYRGSGGSGGGGQTSSGWGWGGGGRASSAPGASSASPRSSSGWFVGPGGVMRRGLESVPGPWRPYWRGEDSVGTFKDGGMALATKRSKHEGRI